MLRTITSPSSARSASRLRGDVGFRGSTNWRAKLGQRRELPGLEQRDQVVQLLEVALDRRRGEEQQEAAAQLVDQLPARGRPVLDLVGLVDDHQVPRLGLHQGRACRWARAVAERRDHQPRAPPQRLGRAVVERCCAPRGWPWSTARRPTARPAAAAPARGLAAPSRAAGTRAAPSAPRRSCPGRPRRPGSARPRSVRSTRRTVSIWYACCSTPVNRASESNSEKLSALASRCACSTCATRAGATLGPASAAAKSAGSAPSKRGPLSLAGVTRWRPHRCVHGSLSSRSPSRPASPSPATGVGRSARPPVLDDAARSRSLR